MRNASNGAVSGTALIYATPEHRDTKDTSKGAQARKPKTRKSTGYPFSHRPLDLHRQRQPATTNKATRIPG